MWTLVTSFKSSVALVVWLVLTDIAGVVLLTVIDVLPLRFKSAALAYVVWLVFGVFCGLFAFNTGGRWALPLDYDDNGANDWTGQPGAAWVGNVNVAVSVLVLAGLSVLFHRLYWSKGVAGEYYVPDSQWHTVVFFVSVLAGIFLARWTLMPKA